MQLLLCAVLCDVLLLILAVTIINYSFGWHRNWRVCSRSLIWPSMLVMGLITSACMALLCIFFTGTLIFDATKSLRAAPAPAASANSDQNLPTGKIDGRLVLPQDANATMSGLPAVAFIINGLGSPTPKAEDKPASPNDAISSAMTAVALAISTITLVTTIGTSWFARKMKELEEATKQYKLIEKNTETAQRKLRIVSDDYNKTEKEIKKKIEIVGKLTKDLHNEAEQIMNGRSLLLDATIELYERLKEGSQGGINPMLIFLEAQLYLKQLMDKSENLRKDAFDHLRNYLRPIQYVANHQKYQRLQAYFEYCATLHGDGGKYCRVFSENEGDKPDLESYC